MVVEISLKYILAYIVSAVIYHVDF